MWMLLVRCADELFIFNSIIPAHWFYFLAAGRNKLSENVAAIIGVGSVGLSALFALIAGLEFVNSGSTAVVQHLWTWFSVGTLPRQ
jgi:NADH-quinone oxidoreductase subunit L